MASFMIHMCIAKKVNEQLKIKDENTLLLGSIAPDISKHIGQNKVRSHFLDVNNVVQIDEFIKIYGQKLDNDFILGYFIHLYSDYLWEKYFTSEIINKDSITLLDGKKIARDHELYKELLYHDYTNLNIKLIDKYNMDLSLFYEEYHAPQLMMREIPVQKLNLLLNYAGMVVQNSESQKTFSFNINNVITFINTAAELIVAKLNEIKKEI